MTSGSVAHDRIANNNRFQRCMHFVIGVGMIGLWLEIGKKKKGKVNLVTLPHPPRQFRFEYLPVSAIPPQVI